MFEAFLKLFIREDAKGRWIFTPWRPQGRGYLVESLEDKLRVLYMIKRFWEHVIAFVFVAVILMVILGPQGVTIASLGAFVFMLVYALRISTFIKTLRPF